MVAEDRMHRYEEFLSQTQQRLTSERRIIAEVAFRMTVSPAPEVVFRELTRVASDVRISRSTCYRTLAELQRAGLI